MSAVWGNTLPVSKGFVTRASCERSGVAERNATINSEDQ
jgi:hypothetical protein